MLYMVTFTINLPPVLVYIPAPWILWVIAIFGLQLIYTLETGSFRLGRRSFHWRFRGLGLAVGCLPSTKTERPGVFTEVATLPRNTCETTRQIRQELTTYYTYLTYTFTCMHKIWCNWDFDTAGTQLIECAIHHIIHLSVVHDSSPLNVKPTIMDNKNISRPFINDLKIEDAHFEENGGMPRFNIAMALTGTGTAPAASWLSLRRQHPWP